MSNLVIKLTGEIQNSNFDEWKEDLLTQIAAVNTDLSSDSDFASASKHVKTFKSAEQALKKAKTSAIKQASDISSLFEAIDEVQAQTREVRLTLERQVKTRKKEIKQEFIDAGIEKAEALIEAQSDDFKLIDTRTYTARDIFEEAVKGKASRKGLQKAIDTACTGIEDQIKEKAGAVKANAASIDSLAAGYKILFQDRSSLLDLPKDELDTIIDQRVEKYNEEQNRAKKDSAETAVEPGVTDQTDNPDGEDTGEKSVVEIAPEDLQDFELVITLRSSEDQATALLDSIKDNYLDRADVSDVVLRGL